MKDGSELLAALATLVFSIAALFLMPLVAVIVIPAFGYYWWKNNPSRQEEEAKKLTWALYEEAKSRLIGTVDADAIFDKYITNITPENFEWYSPVKDLFINLWIDEGYDIGLKPPPPMCNSIAGGKYRDYINRVPDNRPALIVIAKMINNIISNKKFNLALVHEVATDLMKEEAGTVLFPNIVRQMKINHKENGDFLRIFEKTVLQDLKNYRLAMTTLPDELRTSHHHIVAGTGAGKTQCLQQLILNDLKDDVAIVVIDSQGDFINKLATRIEPERLILVDPEHCAPALNLFAKQESEKQIATAIELYEYIFSSLETELTTKQSTVYRFVSRLLMTIPNANIHTMLEILEDGGAIKYQKEIDQLGPTAKSVFTEFNKTKQSEYGDTRKQIRNRLYAVLENKTLESMLGATESRLNIGKALDSGKVVLISTAKGYLKQTGASLLGRIFIAQVMQSVMAREANRKRTYLYIDEFQDYAEDSHVLFNLFEQARKYNLGLIISHQYLAQLPMKLKQSISANTAIKFARNVSAEDSKVLAQQMFTTPEFIQNQGKGDFACYLKGQEVSSYHVEFGRLERTTELSNLSSIRDNMRARYGVPSPTNPLPPKKPLLEPSEGWGSGEVVEEKEVETEERSKW